MQHQQVGENNRFGRYLRKIREDRRLSLDAVEEMTNGFPERVTKSHLSRIENGQAVPTFPRLFALSQVYGVPISFIAERFETDLFPATPVGAVHGKHADQIVADIEQSKLAGNYSEALALVLTALDLYRDGPGMAPGAQTLHTLHLYQIDCLIHLERYESAKVECEILLTDPNLAGTNRTLALLSFVITCYRLKRFTIAQMGLDHAQKELRKSEHPPKLAADIEATQGAVWSALAHPEKARDSFTKAMQLYDAVPNPHEASRARVNLAQTLIDLGEAEKALAHLRVVLKTCETAGYERLRALALSHIAVVSIQRGELGAAEAYLLRSNAIARQREYVSLIFRNCYYLRKIAQERGEEAAANACERTLKTYFSRVDSELPEAVAYRAELAGGQA